MTDATPDWEGLRDSVAGAVVLPGSPTYESTRKSAIANFRGIKPRAVVLCETAEDVSETILFARRCGLRTVPRGEDDRLGEGTDEQQGHLYSKSGFFRRPLPREAV